MVRRLSTQVALYDDVIKGYTVGSRVRRRDGGGFPTGAGAMGQADTLGAVQGACCYDAGTDTKQIADAGVHARKDAIRLW